MIGIGSLAACKPDAGLTKFNSVPEAQITAPGDGSDVLAGTTLTLRGQASDPNHATGELLARWFVGADEACAGAAPDADGTTTCEVRVPADADMAVRLEVLDPEGAAGVAEATYAVTPNEAPVATIQSPTAGGVYYSDQLITLQATVADAEDAPTALVATWESSRDGVLTGAFNTPDSAGLLLGPTTLSEGSHFLTLAVTDTAGNVTRTNVTVDVGPPNSAPGCAITAPTSGGASTNGERVDFAASVTDVDVPANLLRVAWESDKDGPLGGSTPDSAGNVAFSTAALTVDTHRVTMTVTDEVGATCASAITWTVGTPPAITLESPLPGEVVNDGSALTFAATVSDGEDVAGDLRVRWESDLDGVFHEGAPDGTGLAQLVASDLTVGDHVLTVTVTDSAGLTATALGTFTVNGIPSAPAVRLTPGTPTTTDDLVVVIDTPSVDPEGDPLTYAYAWSRDGVPSGASSGATLPASATADGEVWTVDVWASDGLAESPVGSARVTIANTPPTLAGVTLTPDPARRGDTLTCTPAGAADADGDSITYTYAWTVDGVAAGAGATLTGPFALGALIACTVTPTDGKDDGAAVSDSVRITNTAPVVSSVSLSPGTVYTNDTLTASVVTSDADGDTVGVTYRWLVDGVEVPGATGASLSGAASFDRDQVVTVEVTPNDGTEDGAALTSAGVTVQNSAPTAPGIAITPESPEAGDDLTCSVVTPSTDADGDALTYAFAWDVDGSGYGGATDAATESVVAGADVGGGETWTCAVAASDARTSSASASAMAETGDGCVDTTAALFDMPVAGSVADVSPYTRSIVVVSTTLLDPDRDSTPSGALVFNGATYAEIPASTSLNTSNMTFAAWVRTDATTAQTIFSRSNFGDASGEEYYLGIDPARTGSEIEFSVKQGSGCRPGIGWQRNFAPASLSVGRWHHIAATFDAGHVAMYIDGVLAATSTTPATTIDACGGALHLGGHWRLGTLFLDGALDRVVVLPSAADAAAIEALYSEPASCGS
jgi:hypothetical protein